MRIIEHDDGPIVAVAGWGIKVVVDALRVHVQVGGASARAATLVAVLDAVTPKLRLQPCVCSSVEHQVAGCPERPVYRLRSV
ncbi:hypothetical protein [Streptomyces scabiei]|uniref:hypothetical protein n=1 Tax=Streptomyces scabiei TaxID=1930 RepID=UPI0029B00469|nr:hypothetical protein [Streptomyces scabiei]MDX3205100.1 hypothetical protein [Streptomyces scabiei]